ncbi:MAG: hypothetical protein K2Q04_01695 [Hyphomicrobium sp.]|nr:hypothetical protein [Hyphomicrobium sp.]
MPRTKRAHSKRGSDAERSLLEATLRVVARDGVKSVTHRKVVAEAGQALGSTHYYYEDLDDLILTAFAHYVELMVEKYSHTLDAVTKEEELLDAILVLLDALRTDQQLSTLMYELYAQGVRDERYRRLVMHWSGESKKALKKFCTAQTANEIEAIWDGMAVQSLLTLSVPADREIKRLLRAVLEHGRAKSSVARRPAARKAATRATKDDVRISGRR